MRMDSLTLDENTSSRLKAASEGVKLEIERHYEFLMTQMRSFRQQKEQEYREFVRNRLDEAQRLNQHEPNESQRHSPREQLRGSFAATADSRKHIKSIVKRRPSSGDKRVSFSKSPPKVEVISNEDELEDDMDASRSDRGSTDDDAGVTHTTNGSAIAEDILEEPLPPLNQNGGWKIGEISSDGKAGSPINSLRSEYSDSWNHPKVVTPYTYIPAIKLPNNDTLILKEEELFELGDDTSELPAVPDSEDLSVTAHSSSRNLETVEPLDSDSSSEKRGGNHNKMIVGSAPVDIKSNPRILEGDGGPPAKAEADKILEESIMRLSMDRPIDTLSKDPSHMSFCQRMEWEKYIKLRESNTS